MNLLLKAAKKYLSRKFSVIPVAKSKKPVIEWEKYQKELATEEDAEKWWANGSKNNIAIITGVISNLVVIDIDDLEMAQPVLDTLIPEFIDIPTVQTPKKGRHLYFQCPNSRISNNTRIIPGADFRANGGYIIVPPSTNYIWINEIQEDIPRLPQAYIDYISSHSQKKEIVQPKESINYFEQGRRDNDLFTIANSLIKNNTNSVLIAETLRRIILSWGEQDEKWIKAKVESSLKRDDLKSINLTEEVRSWVITTQGYFLISDVYRDLQITDKLQKKKISKILYELINKENLIERVGNKNGCFRKLEKNENIIDWQNADIGKSYDIILPFKIHDLVNIYPKNIIIIAGMIDSGKSAFMLNILKDNMEKHKIYYFSSEMGAQELKIRLANFKGLHAWNFTAIERAGTFADVIRPDDLNIIDFLEISDNFFAIGAEIKKIYDKLEKGIAIIGIQKKKGVEYGRGAEFSMEKARLYITLDSGTLKIIKAKNWKNHRVNPSGKIIDFKLFKGCEFQPEKKQKETDSKLIIGPKEWQDKY